MKTLLVAVMALISIECSSQRLFTLYLSPHLENQLPDAETLVCTKQYFTLEERNDSTFLKSPALEIVFSGHCLDVFFVGEWEGPFTIRTWKSDPHYFLFYVEEAKVYYFFYELFPWLDLEGSPYSTTPRPYN